MAGRPAGRRGRVRMTSGGEEVCLKVKAGPPQWVSQTGDTRGATLIFFFLLHSWSASSRWRSLPRVWQSNGPLGHNQSCIELQGSQRRCPQNFISGLESLARCDCGASLQLPTLRRQPQKPKTHWFSYLVTSLRFDVVKFASVHYPSYVVVVFLFKSVSYYTSY